MKKLTAQSERVFRAAIGRLLESGQEMTTLESAKTDVPLRVMRGYKVRLSDTDCGTWLFAQGDNLFIEMVDGSALDMNMSAAPSFLGAGLFPVILVGGGHGDQTCITRKGNKIVAYFSAKQAIIAKLCETIAAKFAALYGLG